VVQSLTRCRSCAMPQDLAGSCAWAGDGSIRLRPFRGNRIAIVDLPAIEISWQKLASLGASEPFLLREKYSMRRMTARVMVGIGAEITRFGALKKRALEVIEELFAILGLGRIEIERFSPGQEASILLVRPVSTHLLSAGIAGILEELDNVSYAYSFSDLGEKAYRLNIEAVGDGQDYGAAWEHYKTGEESHLEEHLYNAETEVCPICGIPCSLRDFKWDELYGTIKASNAGRMGFMPLQVIRVMGGARDDESDWKGLLEEAIYVSTVEQYKRGTAAANESVEAIRDLQQWMPGGDLARLFSLKGWGRIDEAHRKEEGWLISVFEPIDSGIIAGWLRALYTIALGKDPDLSLVFHNNMVRYRLN
jgi:hypothetical protein